MQCLCMHVTHTEEFLNKCLICVSFLYFSGEYFYLLSCKLMLSRCNVHHLHANISYYK